MKSFLKISVPLCLCGFILSNANAAEFSKLPQIEQARIADLIYRNECSRKPECLVSWNAGEGFASLGIGHFIWFPENYNGPFQESFPQLLEWFEKQHVTIPDELTHMLNSSAALPWKSREVFLKAKSSGQTNALQIFLEQTKTEQASFIMNRLSKALPRMLEAASSEEGEAYIQQQFDRVSASAQGWYVLADYVNFKGEGTNPKERYQGEGWGLMQVLLHMSDEHDNSIAAFVDAAEVVLSRRIQLSPPERGEKRWLAGWKSRLNTYLIEAPR